MQVYITLATPLPEREPLADLRVNTERTAVVFTTSAEGGFGALRVGLPETDTLAPGIVERPVAEIVDLAHVQAHIAGQLVWEGQVIDWETLSGQIIGFEAFGYGVSGQPESTFEIDGTIEATTTQILRDILGVQSPYIRVGDQHQFRNTGVRVPYGDFDGMTATEAAYAVAHAGGSDGALWDYRVWDGPTAHLLPRIPPAEPTYTIPIAGIPTRHSAEQLVGRVRVRYEDSLGDIQHTEWRSTPGFVDRFKRQISRTIPGGRMSQTLAEHFRDTYLQRYAEPMDTVDLTRNADDRGLELSGGGERPLWLVRSGEYVQVQGMSRQLCIVDTHFDSETGSWSAHLNEGITDDIDHYANLTEIVSQLASHISPTTGTRLR